MMSQTNRELEYIFTDRNNLMKDMKKILLLADL